MNKYKISTIIPVYNSETTLVKCIDSIIKQTVGFNNIQLIIINDGSTDNSDKIISNYKNNYENIMYIKKSNSGQANARNIGLKKATGKYISFVDSDDWIELDMYKKLLASDEKEFYNILTCDYLIVKKGNKKYVSTNFTEDPINNFLIMNAGPCNMIIKRSYLKFVKFEFPEGIFYEDFAVIPSLGLQTKKIKLIESALYNYLIRDNSTMNQTKYNVKLKDIFIAIDLLTNKFLMYDNEKKYKHELEFIYINRLLMNASLRFIKFNDPEKCIKEISNIMKKKFPNWKENKYYKKLPLRQKVVALLAFNNNKIMLLLLNKLNTKLRNRG